MIAGLYSPCGCSKAPQRWCKMTFFLTCYLSRVPKFLLGMDLLKNLKPLPHFLNPSHWFLRLGLRIKGTHGRSLLHHISWGRKKPRFTRWATEMTEMTPWQDWGLLLLPLLNSSHHNMRTRNGSCMHPNLDSMHWKWGASWSRTQCLVESGSTITADWKSKCHIVQLDTSCNLTPWAKAWF